VLLLEELVADESPGAGVVAKYELTRGDLLAPDPRAGDRRDFPIAALQRGCVLGEPRGRDGVAVEDLEILVGDLVDDQLSKEPGGISRPACRRPNHDERAAG
jgi:hypothetical protein